MTSSAPKFRKVDLILKIDNPTIPSIGEKQTLLQSSIKISHDDCAMVITGDYVIITEDEGNNEVDTPKSIKGKIYNLKEIDSYRLYID